MYTIAIISQKGGTGKTTTAHAIATGLQKDGARVLMVDADPQGSLTAITGAAPEKNIEGVLSRRYTAAEAITATRHGDIIAAHQSLAQYNGEAGSLNALKVALQGVTRAYDYCVIDCQPIIGALVVMALQAADGAIITALPDAFSVKQAFTQSISAIEQAHSEGGARPIGVLLTKYHARITLDRAAAAELEQRSAERGTHAFKAKIRETVAIREAQVLKETIWEYAPRSTAAEDYQELIAELMDIIKGAKQ